MAFGSSKEDTGYIGEPSATAPEINTACFPSYDPIGALSSVGPIRPPQSKAPSTPLTSCSASCAPARH